MGDGIGESDSPVGFGVGDKLRPVGLGVGGKTVPWEMALVTNLLPLVLARHVRSDISQPDK